mmetsp:Transcript_118122/g.345986  ORF Transcript_118122/g.345986 Transcript_118122/m.345986 type:complete len:271 (-) Transcript_118122:91-903(-)
MPYLGAATCPRARPPKITSSLARSRNRTSSRDPSTFPHSRSQAAAARPGASALLAPRLDRYREPQDEACPEFTSLAIQLGPSPQRGPGAAELDVAGSEYVVARGGDSPRGSDGGSSSSFDLDVDEEWSRRGNGEKRRDRDKYYEDEEDDDDNPVLYSPLFFENFLQSRLMARVAIGEGLRALMDQSWCQVLDRIDEGGDEEPEPTPEDGRASSGESSRDSSVERLWAGARRGHHSGGRRCLASYRMRGPLGPKDDGPLSKLMDQELLESE